MYVQCGSGYVPTLNVQGNAEGCGIGQILMQLCFNEEEKHSVEGTTDDNSALDKMDEYITDCQRANCNLNPTDLKKWVVEHCSKLMYLEMKTKKFGAAHVYFNSAMDSGFRKMFMVPHYSQ